MRHQFVPAVIRQVLMHYMIYIGVTVLSFLSVLILLPRASLQWQGHHVRVHQHVVMNISECHYGIWS
jgi:hypothetical protein